MNPTDGPDGVREVFSESAERYDARQYGAGHRTLIADRQKTVARVLRSLGLPSGACVLDVACGPGHFLLEAAQQDLAPFGVDSSLDMLRTARNRVGPRATLARGDATRLPYASHSFDALNCSGLIEYLTDPLPALREMARVLKPGGHALIASTNRLSPALLLEPLVDATRRSSVARRILRRLPQFDEGSLQERKFRLTFHTPRKLASLLGSAGFEPPTLHYYHLQLVPHPLERLAPRLASACVMLTDRLLSSRPKVLAEGLLAAARLPR